MKKIERIYISCCRRDVHLTRPCVASIRYWHPDIPITLVKDHAFGTFDTSEIERVWNVSLLSLPRNKFGWAFSKLEPFLVLPPRRILVLDTDIVFVGPLLDRLDTFDEDFVVDAGPRKESEIFDHFYRTRDIQATLDPGFRYPGYIFNTGHVVATSGCLSRGDLDPLISWEGAFPALRYPEIFSQADQGVLNYLIQRKQQRGEVTVGSFPFSVWGDSDQTVFIDLDKIRNREGVYQKLVHFAGPKPLRIRRMSRPELLLFFEEYYYSRIPCGHIKRNMRSCRRILYFGALDRVKSCAPRALIDTIKKRI